MAETRVKASGRGRVGTQAALPAERSELPLSDSCLQHRALSAERQQTPASCRVLLVAGGVGQTLRAEGLSISLPSLSLRKVSF